MMDQIQSAICVAPGLDGCGEIDENIHIADLAGSFPDRLQRFEKVSSDLAMQWNRCDDCFYATHLHTDVVNIFWRRGIR